MRVGTTTARRRRDENSSPRHPAAPPATEAGPTRASGRAREPEHEVPRVLDRYRLVRRLGSGGFGTVWKARDEHLQRDVAVKILPRERVIEGRFEREALAAARLAHPAIVTLFEAATDEEGAYLVSELVSGMTLERALERGRLSDRDVLDIGLELCDALAHAHLHGVVHRDVKPSNVLVPSRPSSGARAKLTDFGVARVLGGTTLTFAGERIGTAAYMAPEQAEGREATEAADLYSLALVLYEGFTGVNPVPDALDRVNGRRLALRLPPLRRQRRDLPRGLGAAIDLALRSHPRERGALPDLRAALKAARSEVDDAPGVVAGPDADEPAKAPAPPRASPAIGPARAGSPTAARADTPPGVRALSALAAALLTAWATARLPLHSPVAPATAALAGAFAALVLPRLGWIALLGTTVGLLLAAHRPGLALFLLATGALPVFVLPRAGILWPIGGLAPALGAIGLAGAWPALAARSGGAVRGAALAVLGWSWMWLGAVLAGHGLYTRRPPAAGAAQVWAGSPAGTLHHVIVPLLLPGLLAGAAVWGLAALLLYTVPGLAARRGTRPVQALLASLAWSAATTIATVAALHAVGDAALSPSALALVLGALVSTAVLSVPSLTDAPRFGWRRRGGDAHLA